MGEWECQVCGFIHDGDEPPRACPECGATSGAFKFFAYVNDEIWQAEDGHDDVEFDEDFNPLRDGPRDADG